MSNEDFNVIIFDENRKSIEDFTSLLEATENLVCVGFSIMTGGEQIGHALKLADVSKRIRPNVPTVFGGPHVNVLPEETLHHPLVDIVLLGPGQTSFPPLVKALKSEISLENVPGLLTCVNGDLIRGGSNELSQSTLVSYNFESVDVNAYVQHDSTISDRTINYISSQGCAYRCRFCYETSYRRKYGKLSCENVVSDIKYLIHTFSVNGIKFYDADWFIDSRRAEKITEELTRLDISWAASIHPKDVLRSIKTGESLLKKLAESKCKRLLMGVESGNDRVLSEIVNKGVTKDEIFKVAQAISEYGILGSYTFIVGFPGESVKEQDETFEFIRSFWNLNPRPETRVHIYIPYPGTPLYDEALTRGFTPPNTLEGWSSFDYYKSQTPWTDKTLEQRVKDFTSLIPKL